MLPAVERTPGVATAVPMVQVVTYAGTATDPHEKTIVALGVDCNVEAIVGRFGCSQAGLSALARAGGVAVSPLLQQGIKRWFLIVHDYNFGRSVVTDAKHLIEAAGGTIAGEVTVAV